MVVSMVSCGAAVVVVVVVVEDVDGAADVRMRSRDRDVDPYSPWPSAVSIDLHQILDH